MTQSIPHRRDHVYVNLIKFYFENGEESFIQNFFPPDEEQEGYFFQNEVWYYFPFEVNGLTSSLDFDSIQSTIKMPNIEDVNRIWSTKLNRSNFSELLEGSEVEIIYLFLNPDETDDNNSDVFKPYDPPITIKTIFNVNSLSFSPGIINLQLRSPLNSVDNIIPNRHFSGKPFRELPIDNNPRFTSGISYD